MTPSTPSDASAQLPTPRVDAEVSGYNCIRIDFARKLERENANLRTLCADYDFQMEEKIRLERELAASAARIAELENANTLLRSAVDKAHYAIDARNLISPRSTSHDGLAERINATLAIEKQFYEQANLGWKLSEKSCAASAALCAKLREALEYYNAAPWVGHCGSWAHSNIAKVAEDALAATTESAASELAQLKAFVEECAMDRDDRISPGLKSKADLLLQEVAARKEKP